MSFEIIGQDGKGIKISTIAVPEISAPMKNFITRDVRNLPYLRNLKLAQSSTDASFPISILIGADHYWSIVGDEFINGDGPTAIGLSTLRTYNSN